MTERNNTEVERFKRQKAVRIRSAEGRSASARSQAAAADLLKAKYASTSN